MQSAAESSQRELLWKKLRGEGTPFGASSALLKKANEFLQAHSLSELLPYRSFDPETQIFFNRSSLGFVIETLPLVGCGDEYPLQLTGLFQHSLPLGSNLQCLLIASSRIEERVKTWEHARQGRGEVLEELSKERGAYMRKRARGLGVRTFRLIISYSKPEASSESIEDILSIREQLVTTLKGWGLPVNVWKAEDLLIGLDELLNPSDCLENVPIPWNVYDSLSHQMISPSTRLEVTPSLLLVGEGEKVMKLYTARMLPPIWHLGGMSLLIGDPFDNFLRLQGSFFISYGVHICNEKTLKTQMLAKCGNVEKQAASPIAKYIPSLKKAMEEWRYVREKFEGGQNPLSGRAFE